MSGRRRTIGVAGAEIGVKVLVIAADCGLLMKKRGLEFLTHVNHTCVTHLPSAFVGAGTTCSGEEYCCRSATGLAATNFGRKQ